MWYFCKLFSLFYFKLLKISFKIGWENKRLNNVILVRFITKFRNMSWRWRLKTKSIRLCDTENRIRKFCAVMFNVVIWNVGKVSILNRNRHCDTKRVYTIQCDITFQQWDKVRKGWSLYLFSLSIIKTQQLGCFTSGYFYASLNVCKFYVIVLTASKRWVYSCKEKY